MPELTCTCSVCGWPFPASRSDAVTCSDNCAMLRYMRKKTGEQYSTPVFPTRAGWEPWMFTKLPVPTHNRIADTWTVQGYVSVSGHLSRWYVNHGQNACRMAGPFPTPLAAMEHAEKAFPELFETRGEK